MSEYPHVVTFQRLEKVPNGSGGYIQNYVDHITTEAFVCPVKAFEVYQSQQTKNPVDHSLFYPYQEGVLPDMRAYWHDRETTLTLRSRPLDQGGQGEVLMVKCSL
jgi:SPP1 family predicted phage head-tail adaptor